MDTEQLEIETLARLGKISRQVKWLLIKFPECRSNDKVLYLKVLQYFSPNLIYDSTDQKIKPRNNDGWSYEEWMRFPSYETCRRTRQKLQEEAGEHIKAGYGTEEDKNLLPSDKVATQRGLLDDIYTRYFAKG